jgi:WS/DGAT/MGAT family acyltransferase
MAEGYYERVSTEDLAVVEIEPLATHRHLATVLLFDSEPLRRASAGIDLPRLQGAIAHALAELPRYRQRLARVPLEGSPVWIDDPAFDLEYHVQHLRLPAPGDERELKRLVARMLAAKLDRTKPLWELCVVEGLAFERFALVTKIHPALVRSGGADLLTRLLKASGESVAPRTTLLRARPAPGALRWAAQGITERLLAAGPGAWLRGAQGALGAPLRLGRDALGTLGSLATALGRSDPPPAPFGTTSGPHRTVDWIALGADELESVGVRLGFEPVEILVGVIAAALRVVLRKRDAAGLEPKMWAATLPEGTRIPLPVGEADPIKRIVRARSALREVERGPLDGAALRGDGPAVWSTSSMQAEVVRAQTEAAAADLGLLLLPGPRAPLYLCGARLERAFPLASLAPRQPLALAVVRYRDTLGLTLNADRGRLADLSLFTDALVAALAELRGSDLPRRRTRPPRPARSQPVAEA